MLKRTEAYREKNTIHVGTMEELINTLNEKSGFVSCYWNENSDDENRIKDLTKATLRCYLIDTDKKEKSVNEKSKDGRLAIFSKAY